VETIYLRNPALAQLYVHGDSLKSYLVCIAVPDPDGLALFASQHGIKGDFKSLCSDPRVLKAVLDNLTELGKQEGLHGFEQPKAIRLHPEPFTPENGLLTPTAKSKRNELAKFFKPAIDQMYKEVGLD
jgi:long-chain acyl-CoA synthetase